MEKRPYDIVIFGASGFTGQYVIDEVARTAETEGIKWAVAGRSIPKLIQAVRDACDRTGKDLSDINVIRADVSDVEALASMASQTKCVLNCVGPYRFYGEPVVKACVEQGTHHLDISGEPGFLDDMALKYDSQAQETGSYVVESCGWDTIPSDMGLVYLQKQFSGDLAWVENYVSMHKAKRGAAVNFGTFHSAIYCISNFLSDLKLHKKVMDNAIPKPSHPAPKRLPVFYGGDVSDWCLILPDSEKCIVERSQKYNYQENRIRPVQFANAYFRPGSFIVALFFMFIGSWFVILSFFKFGRNILEKYPHIVSGGLFRKGGPKPEQVAASSFSMTMVGTGWSEKLPDPDDAHTDKPDQKIRAVIRGPDMAYLTTPICMVNAAYCLLKEPSNIPKQGGVYTPASVFSNTSLIERLHKAGVTFNLQD